MLLKLCIQHQALKYYHKFLQMETLGFTQMVDYSETILEYMEIYMYQRSRSFFDLCLRSFRMKLDHRWAIRSIGPLVYDIVLLFVFQLYFIMVMCTVPQPAKEGGPKIWTSLYETLFFCFLFFSCQYFIMAMCTIPQPPEEGVPKMWTSLYEAWLFNEKQVQMALSNR